MINPIGGMAPPQQQFGANWMGGNASYRPTMATSPFMNRGQFGNLLSGAQKGFMQPFNQIRSDTRDAGMSQFPGDMSRQEYVGLLGGSMPVPPREQFEQQYNMPTRQGGMNLQNTPAWSPQVQGLLKLALQNPHSSNINPNVMANITNPFGYFM